MSKSNYYFDNELARDLLIKMQDARVGSTNIRSKFIKSKKEYKHYIVNEPSNKLLELIDTLYNHLLLSRFYYMYDAELKEEMKSAAIYEFLKYGHNYNSAGSAMNYLTTSARRSFERVIMDHYKQENINGAFRGLADELYEWRNEDYLIRLISDRNGEEELDT